LFNELLQNAEKSQPIFAHAIKKALVKRISHIFSSYGDYSGRILAPAASIDLCKANSHHASNFRLLVPLESSKRFSFSFRCLIE
jgi:hypothetical protein